MQAAPSCCLLCPRRYAPGQAPTPSYLNPKLLSQYTSAHTGRVYPRHITGLCSAMQARVELEALRSQVLCPLELERQLLTWNDITASRSDVHTGPG